MFDHIMECSYGDLATCASRESIGIGAKTGVFPKPLFLEQKQIFGFKPSQIQGFYEEPDFQMSSQPFSNLFPHISPPPFPYFSILTDVP